MKSFYRSLLFVSLLFLPGIICGQTVTPITDIPAGEARLYWDERPLEMGDFRPRKSPNRDNEYYGGNMAWDFDTEKVRKRNLIYDKYIVNNWFNRAEAWAVPDHFSNNDLRYNQLIFDISEVYRRKAQNGLNNASYATTRDSLLYYESCMDAVLDEVRNETARGENEAALSEYEDKVKTMLEITEIRERVPVIGDYDGGIGFYINVVQSVFMTNVAPVGFSTPTGLNMGFAVPVNKSVYLCDVSAKFGKLTEGFDYLSLHFPQTSNVELCSISLGYERRVLSTDWWDILPFGMIGITTLNMFDINSDGQDKHSPDRGLSLSAGVDVRFKYYRRLLLQSGFSEYTDSAIYWRVYLSREQHAGFGGILSLNFGLGIDLFAGSRMYN